MSRCSERASRLVLVAALVATLGASGALAAKYGFGKPALPEEIAGWDIDVRPDGTGLPPGRGTVAQGQAIYDEKCATCHGVFGESNSYLQLAGGVGSLGSDQPVRTTGSKLNYATTLWDYINRAMPFGAPQTLKPDEVYALTAFILNLNDILPADAELDRESLPRVRMPNRNGFTTNHGFMRRDGQPDTRNTACMRDCSDPVKLSSQMPEYARNQHGNLDEQRRDLGGVRGVGSSEVARVAQPKSPLDLAKTSSCTACHGVSAKIVGPAFRDVAAKYAGNASAQGALVAKLGTGGVGVWGNVPMPPQPHLSSADATALIQWILAGAK